MPVNATKIISNTTNKRTINYDNNYTNISNIPVDVRGNQANYTFTILTTEMVN